MRIHKTIDKLQIWGIIKMNDVQIGSDLMNKPVTSRDEILMISRKIILEKGIDSLNMRDVAIKCGAAVGSIYNYFPSKAELLSAAVESVWRDIFEPLNDISDFTGFSDCIGRMFDMIKKGDKKFSGFFNVHSMNFSQKDKEKGREVMNKCFDDLKKTLKTVLINDKNVRSGVFDGKLSEDKFVEYILELLIHTLLNKEDNCQALISMISNCIY